jgi:hypothetical protein
MSDINAYYRENPELRPILMDADDLRQWQSDCACTVCTAQARDLELNKVAMFEDCDKIFPASTDELEDHQYLLCPTEIPVFCFKTRVWRKRSFGPL